MFNQVLRIDGAHLEGFFRILAVSRDQKVAVLAQLPPANQAKHWCVPIVRVEHSLLAELEDQGFLRPITISASAHRSIRPEQLSPAAQKKVAQRKALLLTVFDPKRLSNVFLLDHPKAVLVRDIMKVAGVSRPTAFRLLDRVLQHGFHVSSLYPLFYRPALQGDSDR